MHKKTYLLAALSLSFIAGCSNKAAYEIMQSNKIQACERVSEGQAREDCLRGYEKSFKQYQHERRELLGNKKLAEQKPTVEKDTTGSDN